MMDKKEQTRVRVQRYRDKQKSVTQSPDSVTNDSPAVTLDVTQDMLYPDGTRALLFPPSKFLSPEEDMKVQQNVVDTLAEMPRAKLNAFRGLNNTFIPNKISNPELKIPKVT